MAKQVHLVVFVSTLPPELRSLFSGDLCEFDVGCSYLVASSVDVIGPFVRAQLLHDKAQEDRFAWVRSEHVLTVMCGDFGKLQKIGFDP